MTRPDAPDAADPVASITVDQFVARPPTCGGR